MKVQGLSKKIELEAEAVRLSEAEERGEMGSIDTLGGIAHEFNNLLTVILGNAQLMSLDIDSTHPHHKLVEEIENRARLGALLTGQLLGFARGRKEDITKGAETILLVDDEKPVLMVGARVLNMLGYTVLKAGTGHEAVDIYKTGKDKIDLVILDISMPDMGGGKVYGLLEAIDPDVKCLLCSGYNIDGQATEILERGCDGFIRKPFDVKELSGKIREILEKEQGPQPL